MSDGDYSLLYRWHYLLFAKKSSLQYILLRVMFRNWQSNTNVFRENVVLLSFSTGITFFTITIFLVYNSRKLYIDMYVL